MSGITQNGSLKRDDNDHPVMGGTSSSDNATIINSAFDPVTRRLLTDVGGGGSGTVTTITQSTGILLTPNPITTTGTVGLALNIAPIATLGTAGQLIRVNAGATALEYFTAGAGTGTVTSVSVVSANGFAGTVATATTTPAITLTTTLGSGNLALSNGTGFVAAPLTGTGNVVLATAPQFTSTVGIGTSANATIGLTVNTSSDTRKGIVVFANSATQSAALYEAEDSAFNTVWTVDKTGSIISGLNTIAGGKLTLAGSTSGSGVVQVAAVAGSGIVFQLPSTNGSNTNFLQTNGSGVTSWAALPTAASITVGTTTISSGTSTRILYDNAGVLGEYTLTGSGTVVMMQTAPTFVTSMTGPLLIGGSGTTGTQLTLKTTTGNGTTDALAIVGGNNGGTTFATFSTGALSILTTGVFTTGTIELGAASDTTLSRSSAGVLAVEGVVIPSVSSTNILTNKRITRRVVTTTQSATPTINTDNTDMATITGLAQAITSFTTNLSGTPVMGDFLEIQITDNGTARGLTFGASFVASTVALPTTTVISTLLHVLFEWDSGASKWVCVAVA